MKIHAVMPVYHPDWQLLGRGLAAVAGQVEKCWIFNNAEPCEQFAALTRFPGAGLASFDSGTNRGTAWVYNRGAEMAERAGAEAILLLDQDSVPDTGMVATLSDALESLTSEGRKVAAVGPRYRQPGSDRLSGFIRRSKTGLRVMDPAGDRSPVPCVFLIASGMLIPLSSLRAVGAMDEGLFLDHVDTEWCFRAGSRGYGCFGVPGAAMEHSLGMRRQLFWLGRWKSIPVHAPERYYWIARNSMLLRKRNHMDRDWRKHDLRKLAGLLVFNLVFAENGWKSAAMMLRGFRDGLHGGSTQQFPVSLTKSGPTAVTGPLS
jgi:rhamnosyltransferase